MTFNPATTFIALYLAIGFAYTAYLLCKLDKAQDEKEVVDAFRATGLGGDDWPWFRTLLALLGVLIWPYLLAVKGDDEDES